jgi:hypothetical protein
VSLTVIKVPGAEGAFFDERALLAAASLALAVPADGCRDIGEAPAQRFTTQRIRLKSTLKSRHVISGK